MADTRDARIQELEEALCNAQQNATAWKCRLEAVARAMTREGVIKMAHECALEIENIYAVGGRTREQRLLNIECSIRRRISIASSGESYWQD